MTQATSNSIGLKLYGIDHLAQELVVQNRDKKNVLNESHKMRMAVAYGLERFWGEHLRFERESNKESKNKGKYWKSVWMKLAEILKPAGINLPDGDGQVKLNNANDISDTAKAIWALPPEQQRIALMILTQLCDSLVWWTQRYKNKEEKS